MYHQAFMYLNTLCRLDINFQLTTSKNQFVENFGLLLSTIGFNRVTRIPNAYIRIGEGNVFEHVLIHWINEDDFTDDGLIVHFYAEYVIQIKMINKILITFE